MFGDRDLAAAAAAPPKKLVVGFAVAPFFLLADRNKAETSSLSRSGLSSHGSSHGSAAHTPMGAGQLVLHVVGVERLARGEFAVGGHREAVHEGGLEEAREDLRGSRG